MWLTFKKFIVSFLTFLHLIPSPHEVPKNQDHAYTSQDIYEKKSEEDIVLEPVIKTSSKNDHNNKEQGSMEKIGNKFINKNVGLIIAAAALATPLLGVINCNSNLTFEEAASSHSSTEISGTNNPFKLTKNSQHKYRSSLISNFAKGIILPLSTQSLDEKYWEAINLEHRVMNSSRFIYHFLQADEKGQIETLLVNKSSTTRYEDTQEIDENSFDNKIRFIKGGTWNPNFYFSRKIQLLGNTYKKRWDIAKKQQIRFDTYIENQDKLVIYLNGNGESIESSLDKTINYSDIFDVPVLTFNYPDVGKTSVEATSYHELVDSTIRVVEYAVNNLGYNPTNITLLGYSLGGAIAIKTAKELFLSGIPIKLFVDRTFANTGSFVPYIGSFGVPKQWNIDVVEDYISLPIENKMAMNNIYDEVIKFDSSLIKKVKEKIPHLLVVEKGHKDSWDGSYRDILAWDNFTVMTTRYNDGFSNNSTGYETHGESWLPFEVRTYAFSDPDAPKGINSYKSYYIQYSQLFSEFINKNFDSLIEPIGVQHAIEYQK